MERYQDREFGVEAVRLQPGEFFATADGTALSTLLGSCVSVCLFDPGSGVGGMNHFLLPGRDGGKEGCSAACAKNCSARYGSCAMRLLLERLEELGAKRSRLQAKVFGAGRVMAGMADVGGQNASFALDYLGGRRIPVVSSDLGAQCPRRVVFFPATGRVFLKRIRDLQEEAEHGH